MSEIELKWKETIPRDINIYQLENGTILYLDLYATPKRIYVKLEDGEKETNLPSGHFSNAYPHENVLFIVLEKEIYKVEVTPQNDIAISYFREQYEDEKQHKEGVYTIVMNNKVYGFRIWEDPERDGVLLDVSEKELHQKRMINMHRRRFIYFLETGYSMDPMLRRMSNNVILLESPPCITHTRDNFRFFYVIVRKREELLIFDIETTQQLSCLQISGVRPYVGLVGFFGIHDGIISLSGGYVADGYLLMTAKIPENTLEWTKHKYDQLMPRAPESHKSEFLEKFDPISVLGQGGFGCVFEAELKLTKRRYAVKRIPLREKESDINKALEEILALESFDHPGIVRYNHAWIEKPPIGWQRRSDSRLLKKMKSTELFSYTDDCAFLYFQMQLCKSTLFDWLIKNDERASTRLKSWFKQVVEAVDYIHKQNKMHRDLKPSNILIDSDYVVKLCDFGIATDITNVEGSMTWRTSIGTLLYKSPEQSRFYDHRVDIFSLGLILIELCVKINEDQRDEIFKDIRCGLRINILNEDSTAFDLATRLTKLNREERPTMEEILRHPFFSD